MRSKKIAFLGSDGTGKTSLINYTKEQLEKEGFYIDIQVLGWKNFQNPILKILSKIYLNKKTRFQNIEKERLERFKERSWFFYILYYLELWTRYIKIMNSKADAVLMDRYFYEELMSTSGLKFKLFSKITPVPDLCIVLKAPLHVIKNRGHDASTKKLRYFYNNLENLRRYFPMEIIDSSNTVEITYNKIKKFIK